MSTNQNWHGTTIVLIRKGNQTIVAGDGQVSLGNTVLKSKAKKVRKIEKRNVIAGFAGSTADALTLFERLEAKLEKHAGNLSRAAVELAKDWRSDKYLRRLEALMAVADKEKSFIISGTGDVLEPEDGIIGIGSGGNYALAAAKVLIETDMKAEEIAKKAFEDSIRNPEDLDLIEVHDNFTISEIIALEEIGIFKRGEAAQKSLEGETKLGGAIPTNTSGGLKARGHAPGATGIAQVIELVKQLRGEAGDRQVKNAKLALAENHGGTAATAVVHILEAE